MRSIARITLAFAAALAMVFALPALSQDLPYRVGRIAHIEGAASVYQDPDEGWERAYVNAPVTSENSVWTEPGSRAELRVGGTAMRLDEATQLDISRLDDDELDAFVPRGTVSVRVRHYDRNERVIFTTPHARFAVRANGRYRVDVDPDREESRLTVFAGEARVGSDSGRIRVQAGRTVRVFGGSEPSYVVENAYSDPFDRWAESRDRGWVESRSVKYVSVNMTGYEDLDRYGSWREEPEFGALWFPTRVAADWAPYRHGRWDYVRPWGWTWVDDAPWGYAPFHYGRWVHLGDRWAWSPGRREVRPAWAPALVAWVGGSNFSVGVSSGADPSVGWYPLSPYERYQPWYNASPTYVSQVNIIVRDQPQREERRQWIESTRARGITVVNRNVVVDRRPVQQSIIAVRPEVARQVQIAAPATVLPSRNEVIQRRQSVRTQVAAPAAAPGSAPATQRPGTAQAPPTQRGERAGPVARPEFQRRQAAAPPAPEPAKAAPPPAQRVTPPSPAAQQQAREQMLKAREAEILKAREEQQKAREDQAKGRQDQQGARAAAEQKAREEQQKAGEAQMKARAEQQKAAEEQRKARADQMKGRDAEQQKAREDQQKAREVEQQKAREQQQKAGEDQMRARAEQQKAAEEQRKARADQMKGRDAEQQKAREAEQQKAREQQQKAREDQQKAREDQQKAREDQQKAREDQQKAREAEQQKAREQQQKAREDQQKAREAEQQKAREQQQKAGEEQMKARAEQQKAAEEQRKAREAQQNQPRQQQQPQRGQPQPPAAVPQTPQERAQQQRQAREKKAREDKEKEDDDDEKKKGKAGG